MTNRKRRTHWKSPELYTFDAKCSPENIAWLIEFNVKDNFFGKTVFQRARKRATEHDFNRPDSTKQQLQNHAKVGKQ